MKANNKSGFCVNVRLTPLGKKAKIKGLILPIQNKGLLLHLEIVIKVKLKGFRRTKMVLEFFRFFFDFNLTNLNIENINKNNTISNFIMAYMTQEGYDKMVAQLRHMESIERPAASAAIAEAADKGDLSENSEYDAAKENQSKLEGRIAALKKAIAEAKIIDKSKIKADTVQILTTVEMKNVKNGMVMKYTIVSESEANLREGKISSTTPIAQGLLGKKVGDVVEVKIPQGTIHLEILNISI